MRTIHPRLAICLRKREQVQLDHCKKKSLSEATKLKLRKPRIKSEKLAPGYYQELRKLSNVLPSVARRTVSRDEK